MNRKRSSEQLAFSKVNLAAIIAVLIGHGPIGTHAVRVNILSDALCQSCMKAGEVELACHFLLYCPIFSRLKFNYLGRHTFGELSEAAETNIYRLNKFLVSSKRFVVL